MLRGSLSAFLDESSIISAGVEPTARAEFWAEVERIYPGAVQIHESMRTLKAADKLDDL